MRIHLQSDVHVEFDGATMYPAVCSDVTVCAGDIGLIGAPYKLEKYFDEIQKNCEHTIYILGNHEFYHSDYFDVIEAAQKLCEKRGIIFMDEAVGTENLVLDGITFWGTTLWTDFNKGDWFAKDKVGRNFGDFHCVSYGDELTFTADKCYEINQRSVGKINWDADIVITHHSPIVIPHPRFQLSDISYGFYNTELEQKIVDSKIKYWMFGHTHHSVKVDVNGTIVLSNQHGYGRTILRNGKIDTQYEGCGYDPRLIIEI